MSKARRPCDLKVGDVVEFEEYPKTEVLVGNVLHVVCREEDVLGVTQPRSDSPI
jgi:co-chaperonin GroES (HSP10)